MCCGELMAVSLGTDGIELFEDFLKSEFSDENIQFWRACERFKTLPEHSFEKEAEAIFEEYIAHHAPKMVSENGGSCIAQFRIPFDQLSESTLIKGGVFTLV